MPTQTMTGKEKRMMEAARLRYMEDLGNKEIAKRLGVSHNTVRKYFSQEDMEQFKRFYSDRELFQLQQSLEQDIRDGEQLANNLLARAIQDKDASPNTMVRASKLALENRKRKVELLQELGVIQKPKERKEIEDNSGPAEVNINMELVDDQEDEQDAQ